MTIMNKLASILPNISKTERQALNAGDVFIEKDIFKGKIDINELLSLPITTLTMAEGTFINGAVDDVCEMTDDYQISEDGDMPEEIWQFLKDKGFFGLEISTEYGGLGFSTRAHSLIIQKLASRSVTLAVTVMVANSIGPAKLIKQYGTPEQVDTYLNRLATGKDIPCFALTSPVAGSDATSITDTGEVFEQDGELFLKLNWEKRYITLAPKATLLGLAFKLVDKNNLLGKNADGEITVALVPTNTEGCRTGDRHSPLGSAFMNGPTFGKDVILPVSSIIGGRDMAGEGWRMLMEALSVGRAISLPAMSVANMKRSTLLVGEYAGLRKQFGLNIGKFEGIQDPLARIATNAYVTDSAVNLLSSAIDNGVKPAVASAILKYTATERSRESVNDAMDILGGIGIMEGKHNFMANWYKSLPVGITVEGANILTRSLIIFGQGSVRAHPYIKDIIDSIEGRDFKGALKAVAGMAGFTVSLVGKGIFHNLTRGFFIGMEGITGVARTKCRKMQLTSLNFAILAHFSLMILGGDLKKKERISGLLADMLSETFLAATTFKRFVGAGMPDNEEDLFVLGMDDTLGKANAAMFKLFSLIIKGDKRVTSIAKMTQESCGVRNHVIAGMVYKSTDINDPMGRVSKYNSVEGAVKVNYKTCRKESNLGTGDNDE